MFGGADKATQIAAVGREVLNLAAGQQPISVVLRRDNALARLYAKSDYLPNGLGFDEAPGVEAPDDDAGRPVLLAHHVRSYLAELRRRPGRIGASLAAVNLAPADSGLMMAMVFGCLEDDNPAAFSRREGQLLADLIESCPRLQGVELSAGGLASRFEALLGSFTEDDWGAAEESMIARVKARRSQGVARTARPCEKSARIAAFYPAAQQRAVAGLPDAAKAVVQGCVRRHDKTLFLGKGKKEAEETPLYFPRACSGAVDVEGDLLACCGDLQHDELRDCSNFVGFYHNLHDVLAGKDLEWGMIEREVSFVRRKRGGRGTWVSSVLADSAHELVWGVDSGGGVVRAYSTATRALVGATSLPQAAARSTEDYLSFSFGMCRADDALLVSAATGSVYALAIPALVAGKSAPKAVKVYDDKLAHAGAMAAMDESTVVVAPLRADGAPSHSSMRVLDLPTGKVKQVLAGHIDQPTVGRQHCGRHLLLSYDETRAAKLWDLRAGVPQLSIKGSFLDAVAIPLGASGCAAVTSGRDECLRAWDLRQHLGGQCLYKMGTGNLVGKTLHWSASLSSLFVGTYSEHETTHGRYSSYRYGKALDAFGEQEESASESESEGGEATPLQRALRGSWPKRAVHPRSAWELPFDHADAPKLLMYPFGTTDIGTGDAPGSSQATTPERPPATPGPSSPEKGPAPVRLRTLPRSEDDFAGVGDIDMHFALRGDSEDEESDEGEEEELGLGELSDGEEAEDGEGEAAVHPGGDVQEAASDTAAPSLKRARGSA